MYCGRKRKYLSKRGSNFSKLETLEKKKRFVETRYPVASSRSNKNNADVVETSHSLIASTSWTEPVEQNVHDTLCDSYVFENVQKDNLSEVVLEEHSNLLIDNNGCNIRKENHNEALELENETIQNFYEIDRTRIIGTDSNINCVEGRRIVSLAHFTTEVRKLENHECSAKKKGYLTFEREVRKGMKSDLFFKCTSCDERRKIDTNPEENEENINVMCVSAAITSGKGLSGIQDVIGGMNIPVMSPSLYRKCHDTVGEEWFNDLTSSMQTAALEEWQHSNEKNEMFGNIASCTVIVDGGWSHRSYGHSYSAKSGVAVIIGSYTKKILFIGIRNKYCSICAIAKRKGASIPEHKCFANWQKSSPAMEADIIVEGFKNSESMYNLRYTKFIGDGDSSVYKKIQDNVSYGLEVEKIECTNHLVKRVKKKLYSYAGTGIAIRRRLTQTKITEICKYCNKLISLNSTKNNSSLENMRSDLKSVIKHCFGEHSMCRREICSLVDNKDNVYSTLSTDMKVYLNNIIYILLDNAKSLMYHMTSNRAEQYMRQVAKFTGGKQIFYGRRNSFNIRCYGAGLSYQNGPTWVCNRVKGKFIKEIATRRNLANIRFRNFKKYSRKSNIICGDSENNKDYGEHCQKPDMDVETLNENVENLLATLNVTTEESYKIEQVTIGQAENDKWFSERKFRLTASNFGAVCKRIRRSAGTLVKNILYVKVPDTDAILWGKSNEICAIEEYEKQTGITVTRCGLFVCSAPNLGFLAASPDGLVGKEKIIEVKCPYSIRDMHPIYGSSKVKSFFAKLSSDNKLVLNRQHDYYYQIQGQLYITQRKQCDFVIWTTKGISIETISLDEKFVEDNMIPKLRKFFVNELAVEIVDSRKNRNLSVRNS